MATPKEAKQKARKKQTFIVVVFSLVFHKRCPFFLCIWKKKKTRRKHNVGLCLPIFFFVYTSQLHFFFFVPGRKKQQHKLTHLSGRRQMKVHFLEKKNVWNQRHCLDNQKDHPLEKKNSEKKSWQCFFFLPVFACLVLNSSLPVLPNKG